MSAASEGLVPPVALEDPAAPRLRVRVTYRKLDRARFISHLELIQVFARAASRAGLPLAFSRGFHPQPRMRFSPGLPLGAESECEVLDIDLTADLDAAEVGRAFGAQLPEGFSVVEARAIALRAPSPEHGLNGFRYDIAIDGLFNGDGGAGSTSDSTSFAAPPASPSASTPERGIARSTPARSSGACSAPSLPGSSWTCASPAPARSSRATCWRLFSASTPQSPGRCPCAKPTPSTTTRRRPSRAPRR